MNILIVYEDFKDVDDSRLAYLYDILSQITKDYSAHIKYTELNFNSDIVNNFSSLNAFLSKDKLALREPIYERFCKTLNKIIECDILVIIPSLTSLSHSNLISFLNCAEYVCMPHKDIHKKLNHITALTFSSHSFKLTNFLAHSLTLMGVKNLLNLKNSTYPFKNDSLNKINLYSFYERFSLCVKDKSSDFTILKFYYNSLSIKFIFIKNLFLHFLRISTHKNKLAKVHNLN